MVSAMNGKEPIERRIVRERKDIQKRGQIKDIFLPQYRKTGLLLNFTFTTSVLVYFGISVISERLFENYSLYIGVSVTNLSELPAIALGLLMSRISWWWMMIYTRTIPALSLAVVTLLWPYATSVSWIWIVNVMLLFAARCLTLSACIVAITYNTVFFPTAIRATAVGLNFAVSAWGVLLAMFIVEDLNVKAALLFLSISSLVSCGISLFLTGITVEQCMTNYIDRSERQTSKKKDTEILIQLALCHN
jgi:hypothetical protein